jgi:membrane protein DedA with SNARE-associated domain
VEDFTCCVPYMLFFWREVIDIWKYMDHSLLIFVMSGYLLFGFALIYLCSWLIATRFKNIYPVASRALGNLCIIPFIILLGSYGSSALPQTIKNFSHIFSPLLFLGLFITYGVLKKREKQKSKS